MRTYYFSLCRRIGHCLPMPNPSERDIQEEWTICPICGGGAHLLKHGDKLLAPYAQAIDRYLLDDMEAVARRSSRGRGVG